MSARQVTGWSIGHASQAMSVHFEVGQHSLLDHHMFDIKTKMLLISGRGFLGLSQNGISAHYNSEPSAVSS